MLHGCARAPLPEVEFEEVGQGNEQPIKQRDGGEMTPDPEPEPYEPSEGDGDSSAEPDAGDGDEPTDPPEDDEADASMPPVDDLTPAPSNAVGCPDKAPKPPFDAKACSIAESLRCNYGASYSCYCAVGGWLCTGK